MKTTDIFNNRSSKKLNEGLEKVFGQKLNLEAFSIDQLEDSRNRLRTQIYTVRQSSGFNETVENESFTKAQWMLDAINAEVMQRESQQQQQSDGIEEGGDSMPADQTDMKLSIGQQMARDGITYSPDKENELIGLMAQYMKKAGMSPKAIRYYLSYDEDFIPDQLSDLPKQDSSKGVAEGSAHGYNVVKWYEKSGGAQLKLTRWLRKEAGLPNDAPVYFDDADLVYGDKTIVRDALVDPNLKFIDLLNAVAQATGGRSKQKVQGVYREQGVAEEKQKGVDGKACWDGYKRMGTKKKGGKTVDNCAPTGKK